MQSPEIIITADGSHSLLNHHLNETYHSVHGALQESMHVFIKNGLDFWCGQNNSDADVLEVGFGTGLNALLTLAYSLDRKRKIRYTTVEAFPLLEKTWSHLNYSDTILDREHFRNLHACRWDMLHQISEYFSLIKHHAMFEAITLPPSGFDVIFYDAFAPAKQPEMWHPRLLEKAVRELRPSGVFVTYCAKGQVKRDLKSLGLSVETLPGPPGKKEMVRAHK